MKILFVAVFDDEGISSNTSQARGLSKLGHEVGLYNYRQRAYALGSYEDRDKELIDACRQFKPDLAIFAKATDMSLEVFWECKKVCKVCYWFPDSLWAYLDRKDFVDMTVISDFFCADKENVKIEGLKYNEKSFRVPDGFDADLEKPRNLEKDIEISFIGSMYGDRQEKIDELKRPVNVYSKAFGRMHSEIVSRSKFNLNFCTEEGASDRIYKIMAAGGFLLSDDWVGRGQIFEDGEHLVIFKDIKDLSEKIAFYQDNPEKRAEISEKGRLEVQKYSRDAWSKKICEIGLDIIGTQ